MSLLLSIIYLIFSLRNIRLGVLFIIQFLILQVITDIFFEATALEKWVKYIVIGLNLFRVIRLDKNALSTYVFLVYIIYSTLTLIFNTTDLAYSGRNYMVMFLSFSALFIELKVTTKEILKSLFYSSLLICIYLICASLYGSDDLLNSYSDNFAGGVFSTTGANLLPLFVWIAMYYLLYLELSITSRISAYITLIICLILLLIIMRRTPLILTIFGLVYLLKSRISLKRLAVMVFGLGIVALIIYNTPLGSLFENQLNARSDSLSIEGLAKEGRLLEPYLVRDYFLNHATIGDWVYGRDGFSTRWFGELYFSGRRSIHSDVFSILCSNGVIGLLLFFTLYLSRISFKRQSKLYLLLLLLSFTTMLTGRLTTSLTFALPFFLLLQGHINSVYNET